MLERVDQPLASDLPVIREIRSTLSKSLENGRGSGMVGRITPHLRIS